MSKDKKKFYDDLKEFFRKRGLTQQNIADRFGVSQSYVASLLNGTNPIGKKTAKKWADEFGLSETWLLTGIGEPINSSVIQNNENGDNYNGAGMTVNKSDAEYLALLKKKDEQIDRLLTIIENMQTKK